jgi:Transposase DDE domain/Domain of unknown function (DUF4372)
VNRFCSIFSQLLKLFSRLEFQQLVKETRAERHARGFPSWDQFVAMLFCQLGRAQSLREICGGLASCEGRLVHLGASAAPSRSTLAYANAHRPWQLYEAVFHRLLGRCQELTARAQKKFRFKNKLLSLDATVIDLCASVFCWAKYQRTKGAVKLHLLLDHDGYLPTVAVITEGRVADVRVARELRFEPGTILIMDRGYVDFAWFDRLTTQGVFFVTRPKTGMAYEVVEHRKIDVDRNLLSDQIIELTSETGQKVTWQLRRIEIWVPEKQQRMALLTNHLDLSALTIAAIYKERWQVELFFKALKQNLKIKTFVGTTANALRIQIWTALIAMLLLRYLQLRSSFGWSLSNLVALLRMNLFVHRDLWAWIDQPFDKPPQIPEPVQAHLALA